MKKKLTSAALAVIVLIVSFFLGSKLLAPVVGDVVFGAKVYKVSDEGYAAFENATASKPLYYYNQLDEAQKQAYIQLYTAVNGFEKRCVVNVSHDLFSTVFQAVSYDNPELFWLNQNYSYIEYGDYTDVKIAYLTDKQTADIGTAQIEKKVGELTEKAKSLRTDYDKELFFNNAIVNMCYYDVSTLNEYDNSIYGVFVSGKSVCEGYSRAMQLLLNRAGIYNYLIVGDADGPDGKPEPHMWNIVEINGKKYHLDVTWNDNEENEIKAPLFFNVSDDFISRNHYNFSPADNGCKYMNDNYFVRNGTYVKMFSGFTAYISASASALRLGSNSVEFLFSTETEYKKAMEYIDSDNSFFNYVNSAVRLSGRNLYTDEVGYSSIDDYYYISINFKER